MEAGETIIRNACFAATPTTAAPATTAPATTEPNDPADSGSSGSSGSSGDEGDEARQRRDGDHDHDHDHDDDDHDDTSVFGDEFIAACKAEASCQKIFTDGTAKTALENIADKCQAGLTVYCKAGEKAVQCLLDQQDAIKNLLIQNNLQEELEQLEQLSLEKEMLNPNGGYCKVLERMALETRVALKNCGVDSDKLDLPEVSSDYTKLLLENKRKEYADKCEGENASEAASEFCTNLKAEIETLEEVDEENSASVMTAGFTAFVAIAAYFL
jgi:hypothetical protein